MNIYDLLSESGARISTGDRWLCYDKDFGWTVYEHRYNAKKATVLLETESESDAVEAMLKE